MTDHTRWIDRDVEKAHAKAQIKFPWTSLDDCKQCLYNATSKKNFHGCNRPTGRTCWQERERT